MKKLNAAESTRQPETSKFPRHKQQRLTSRMYVTDLGHLMTCVMPVLTSPVIFLIDSMIVCHHGLGCVVAILA